MPSHIDKDKAAETIAYAIDRIRTETDTRLLEEYHSLFKKEVPFFHRSKVAACLLMLCDQGKAAGRSDTARTEKPRKAGKSRHEGPADPQRYPLADEESRQLFFSVGRSRRVFPREILGLINTKTAIPKEDIGAIRILDNYSFVQVRDTVADRIIDALNGYNFRGRSLTVNYAKARKDEEENGLDSGEQLDEYTEADEVPDSSPDDSEQGHDHTEEEDI